MTAGERWRAARRAFLKANPDIAEAERSKARARYLEAKAARLGDRKCAVCEKALPPSARSNKAACSRKCKYVLWRLKNPEKYRAAYTRAAAKRHASPARRAKNAAKTREWAKQNPEKIRAWRNANREYLRDLDKRRARIWNPKHLAKRRKSERENGFEKIDRLEVYARDGGLCGICGEHVPRESFTLDHITPLSKGGPHKYSNVVVAHRSCNSAKGNRSTPVQRPLFAMVGAF